MNSSRDEDSRQREQQAQNPLGRSIPRAIKDHKMGSMARQSDWQGRYYRVGREEIIEGLWVKANI